MKNHSLKMVLATLAVLLLGGWILNGCESDSVAPQDEPPELTEENAGYQAAMVALAMTEVGPRILDAVGSMQKEVVTYDLNTYEYVEGSVEVDYRLGGANGSPSAPGSADYGHLTTVGDTGLILTWDGIPNSAMYLTANIMGTIGSNSVTILAGSGGTLTSGVYVVTYEAAGLVFGSGGYPSGGTFSVMSGNYDLTVAFNGTANAVISLNSSPTWVLNLDTGDVSPYMPPTF
jgi:hypothetical protein